MKKILIIGGGIAGLSAGIFAQKNGFDSIIIEKNHIPGGECTGWDRQGYHIDGCIEWLVGTKKGTPYNDLWTKVGALDGVEIYNPETFITYEHESGVTVHFYRNLERLRESWITISPSDEKTINKFCTVLKKMHSYEMPVDKPEDLMSFSEKIKYLFSMKNLLPVFMKYGKVTAADFAKSFKHPALRDAVICLMPYDFSVISIFFALASFTNDQASIPYGGSKKFALRMADRYLKSGGTIETSCEAVEVNIDGNKIGSVLCSNGKTYQADYFIAACDAHVLFEGLLKGKYTDPAYRERYENPKDYQLFSEIQIAIGYEGKLNDIPGTLCFPVEPFTVNGTKIDTVTIKNYSYEPGFAPPGHNIIKSSIKQSSKDYDFWHSLVFDREAYKNEKTRIGEAVINAIEKRFPEMKGKLILLDVATPKTFERYCNAYRGSFMSFMPTVRGKMMAHTGRIKGLENIFLSGQWLQPPGGLPVAVVTGKDTIMRICRLINKPFVC